MTKLAIPATSGILPCGFRCSTRITTQVPTHWFHIGPDESLYLGSNYPPSTSAPAAVLRSSDNGDTWVPLSEGLPEVRGSVRVGDVAADGTVYIVWDAHAQHPSRGLYRLAPSATETPVPSPDPAESGQRSPPTRLHINNGKGVRIPPTDL